LLVVTLDSGGGGCMSGLSEVLVRMKKEGSPPQQGSIELVVLGLLAALIVVLALPLLTDSAQDEPDVPAKVKVEEKK